MRNPVALFSVLAMVVLGTACASSGGGTAAAASSGCELQPKDSVFALHAPVYRDCAVTTKANLISTGVHPDYTPPRGTTCFSAEYEFVVTRDGQVDVASARLVKTNSQQYADAMKAMLARLKYEPAKRDGVAVSQITSLKDGGQIMTMVVPAGSPPPSRPRPSRAGPGC